MKKISMSTNKVVPYTVFPIYLPLLYLQKGKTVFVFCGDDAEGVFRFGKTKTLKTSEYLVLEDMSDSELTNELTRFSTPPLHFIVIKTKQNPEYREYAFFDQLVNQLSNDCLVCCDSEMYDYSRTKELKMHENNPFVFVYRGDKKRVKEEGEEFNIELVVKIN